MTCPKCGYDRFYDSGDGAICKACGFNLMRLNLPHYVRKTGQPILIKSELEDKLKRLEKLWDDLDGHGRDTEQAKVSAEIAEVKRLIELCQ